MKYNNLPAEPPGGGEMLPFVQQFWITAALRSKMLYLVQDFDLGWRSQDLRPTQAANISAIAPDI
ncbi:hypothetical protein QW71_07695 [Paenibacillus sp. IHB B 3415]|uniref:hypothetical protein n=1 Tax=Paenibacillus sp. IHB B 3415 TaxID=867080 RepID=UPI000575CA23|nr:hypothetical protein [Paenibacillus sp. IHB B 3415]KHL96329.1 hypothetical protein QW71_07695 [Paenibacillus sp. IHB B 3415]